jgi:hypothetical protein
MLILKYLNRLRWKKFDFYCYQLLKVVTNEKGEAVGEVVTIIY